MFSVAFTTNVKRVCIGVLIFRWGAVVSPYAEVIGGLGIKPPQDKLIRKRSGWILPQPSPTENMTLFVTWYVANDAFVLQ